MRIVVLGAGIIGVTTAWFLSREGHEVTVLERQPGPALETSFANGGQISVSHSEPWANPRALLRLISWLGREDAPLLWRLRADRAQWAWGLKFLRQCSPARTRANIRALIELGLYSRRLLGTLRNELSLSYDQELRGILHVYTDMGEFHRACKQSEVMRQFGCERHAVDTATCLAIEPALMGATIQICGGTYTSSDESGDAYRFAQQVAYLAEKAGVRFRYRELIYRLEQQGNRINSVELSRGERVEAEHFVVACGSYSTHLLGSVGIRVPVFPAKGYSATFQLDDERTLPRVSLTDDARKLVFSRMGSRLRVAGTAEFAGYNTELNSARCQSIVSRAQAFFPVLNSACDTKFWAGLRPSTPSNVPLIGRSALANLWANTGHGTLGWTLACGSAQLLTDLIAGRPSALSAEPYSLI